MTDTTRKLAAPATTCYADAELRFGSDGNAGVQRVNVIFSAESRMKAVDSGARWASARALDLQMELLAVSVGVQIIAAIEDDGTTRSRGLQPFFNWRAADAGEDLATAVRRAEA